jgi:predicted phosphodiesterase
MRTAVISDIHGNMEALARVLDDIDRSAVSNVICLGDNIGYGPEPETVVRTLRSRRIDSVMGNHELGATNARCRGWFNPVARKALLQTVAMLSADTLNYLTKLPAFLVRSSARFVHGFPPDLITTYLFEASAKMRLTTLERLAETVCFIGHTHTLQLIGLADGILRTDPLAPGITPLSPRTRYLINIGSVGQPRDGDNRAKYVIWDQDQAVLELRCVAYDIGRTAAKIIAAGLPRAYADRLW